MVTQQNVGYTDQFARLVIAVFLIFIFFMNLVPVAYNLIILALSALVMYTAVLRSCEAYTWFGTKTSEKTRGIPVEEAVEKLVGVVAFYLILLLLRFYIL
jgi:hypothetical protein